VEAIFLKLVEVGGLAFALVCVGLIALLRGDVVTKKSHEALMQEKDRSIAREKDLSTEQLVRERERSTELWNLLKPMIGVARASVEKLERERPAAERAWREGG
jgi:hypothetical protein